MTKRKITEADGWLIDGKNNRSSISYWGSREAAEKALLSNKNCRDCTNCSRCSRCSDCSDCSGCSGCSDCSGLRFKIGVTATEGEGGEPPPVPVIPNIHSTLFAAASQPKALDMSDWHTCQNTHCRAGWTVAKAGEAGFALEAWYGGAGSGTTLAAMLIYDASDPDFKINPGRFFDSNAEALADMKRLAELEASK